VKNAILRLGMLVLLSVGGLAHATTEWNAQDYDLYAGDFDGDGKTDILYIAKDPSMPSGIARSDGTGPNIAWQSWASNYLGINWSGNQYNVIVADFNGDGKADIFLQSVGPGNSYLLLTSSTGFVVGISQTIASGAMGLTWSADQHHIVAGDFNGDHKSDLFLQATSSSGTNAVVFADSNGMFTSASPAQTWTDGYLGFKWSTVNANVFAGDFNGDGLADLLIQAKPNFVMIDYDVPFPVPTYPPNMNGVVLSQGGTTPFTAVGAQAWSRMNNGVDWSPLTNNVVIATDGSGKSEVILQARSSTGTSYELTGNATGAIFPSTSTALSSNVSLSASNTRLIAANFAGGKSQGQVGLFYQALTSAGTNYTTTAVGATITATTENPTTVTGTVEPTSAGRTAGQFSIAPTGGAIYNIPIWTPSGAREIEPHLALHYTSGGPDGPMGPGWALSGVSAIARCGKTWASNGAPSGVTLAPTDDLCIDGNRLRLTGGVQGMTGSTYQAEIADFSNVVAYGVSGSPLQYFIVQGKDGHLYEYGNTGNSQAIAAGTTAPYMWGIDRVSDRQGNNMVFAYNTGATALSINSIQYTSTPGSGSSYGYQVLFTYSSTRTGGTSLTKYVAGGKVSQSAQLSNIQIQSLLPSSTLVRQYNLSYAMSPTTNRPLLASMQECAGATGADCIRPTTFSYQTGAAGWSTTATSTGITGQYGYMPIDLNGDGIPDALYGKLSGSTITWYARIATGVNSYGAEIATGATTTAGTGLTYTPGIIPGAFSGNGRLQFLAPISGTTTTWHVYSYVGAGATGSFTSADTHVSVGFEQMAIDYNGDGLADLVSANVGFSGNVTVRQNITGVGGAVTFASTPQVVGSGLVYAIKNNIGSGAITPADFNNDGKADLIIGYQGTGKAGHMTWTALLSNGFGPAPTAVTLPDGALLNSVAIGDWNGDGCTDVISPSTIWISNCAGGFTELATGVTVTSTTQYLPIDWDGDGQTDLLYTDSTSGNWYLIRSTGAGLAAAVPLSISSTGKNFFVGDQNADGQPDLMYVDTANGYAVGYYLHNGVNAPPDLVSSIADGFGIQFSPSYVPISQSNYSKGTTAIFPDEDFQSPMYVVSQFTASDGIGGTYQNTFTYAGARLNLQGRGFEGFATTTSKDSRNALVHSVAYSQSFPTIGAIVEDDLFQSDGITPISKMSNVYPTTLATTLVTPQCSLCYFPAVSSTTTKRYEVGGTKNGLLISTLSTTYTYDNPNPGTFQTYGTIQVSNSTVTDNDASSPFASQSWNTLITNTIYNNPTIWCLGRPTVTTSQKTAAGQPSLTRTVSHAMDPTAAGPNGAAYYYCRAQTETAEPGTSLQVTSNFGFDACGNTNSVSVVGLDENGVAMPARTTNTSYGTRCQFPESVSNSYSQTTSTAYNYSLGVKQSATDANGVTVSWQYDDFARRTRESRPDSTATTWAYTDCVSISCWGTSDIRLLTTETLLDSTGNTVRTGESFSDGLDRIRIQSGNRVLGVWTTQVTRYDSLGRKVEFDLPYSSASNGYHLYSYDLLNRMTFDTLYTTSGNQYRQISMGYFGQIATVTDPKGNVVTKITDVAGKMRRITDPPDGVSGLPAGVTNYTYDSFDNLVGVVDPIGASSTFIYNIRGFKTKTMDADTGIWTFAPDSLNELKTQADANGNVTKMTYDLLGRLVSRLEPESTTPTTWTYGTSAAAHNIGQVQSVTKPDGYVENYYYDSYDRSQTKTVTEDGTTYQFDYAYNSIGAAATLTYPTSTAGVRFQLKYNYDVSGYLNSVQDAAAGTVFWTLTGSNDSSSPTMEVLGNAVSIATAYTPWTNEMITRSEGSAGSQTNLQNLSYAWDVNGNLLSRTDNRQNLTEAFTVDALNRLSTVNLNGSQTLSVRYDQAGDITSKSDVGTYTYPASTAAHPHAVIAAGGWTIGYDANGNMNSRAGGAITSYSYNQPNQINYNGSSAQFNYDSSHQRWKQVANYAGTTETIHYVGGLLQVVTRGASPTEYRHQIAAGSSTAVYTRRSDGSTGTYYATSDHLGSADLVMDSAANVLVRESFSPFGARRGANWQGIPTTQDYTAIQSSTRQGFTGHEMLDAVGLIHMNGRVYDPTLGRFLSPDTVVQSLASSQSINPYSYAWNAPLRYVDPSGHSLLGAIIGIIATIVAIYFMQPELFEVGSTATLGADTAFVSGFVGGFVGAFVSTGSLDAAITGGIIGGITALAFNQAGSWAQQAGAEWKVPVSVLAHAAVGCGSAALSGANCGRGAFAAAVSDAADLSGLIKPAAIGTWGSVEGTAESGLVGGIAARITGGKFSDGFSTGAAGYLFNTSAHTMQEKIDSMIDDANLDPEAAGIGTTGHAYHTDALMVCSTSSSCTMQNVKDSMLQTQVPGYNGSIVDGGVYPVRIPLVGYVGEVQVTIDGDAINNETLPGHLLYYGYISRVAVQMDDGIYLTTYGAGANILGPIAAFANYFGGRALFTQQDLLTKQYFDSHYNGK
jgi:RHS repeat-associated protein